MAIFIAPYLSQDARTLCRDFDVGYLDFVGNARITFDTVFIEGGRSAGITRRDEEPARKW
ncbi:hypothetical protein CWR43_05100 [Rhizobium sullae]|uniref:Uncharacterized protein n=1 Tax=Rhizobium sullae TaxID=50338 RepID=A0A2N0DGH0_RHISU|nr:hypothetical protein CWR43_05100 [Rhizobium sullae]